MFLEQLERFMRYGHLRPSQFLTTEMALAELDRLLARKPLLQSQLVDQLRFQWHLDLQERVMTSLDGILWPTDLEPLTHRVQVILPTRLRLSMLNGKLRLLTTATT